MFVLLVTYYSVIYADPGILQITLKPGASPEQLEK